MNKGYFQITAYLLFLIVFSGCPRVSPFGPASCENTYYVYSVDGKFFKDKWNPVDIDILPGKHTLVINTFDFICHIQHTGYVNFIAEPDRVYHFKYYLTWRPTSWQKGIYVWVEDAETGKVVSQEKPPPSPYFDDFEEQCLDSAAEEYGLCGKSSSIPLF